MMLTAKIRREKSTSNPYFILYTKTNSKWTTDYKTVNSKTSWRKLEENLYNHKIGKNFLGHGKENRLENW